LEAVFTANRLTVTDKQTIKKILNINHKNTHIKTIRIKENKQLNIQQKQNYPGSVAFYNSRPGNEVGLFYNGPENHTGQLTVENETFHKDFLKTGQISRKKFTEILKISRKCHGPYSNIVSTLSNKMLCIRMM